MCWDRIRPPILWPPHGPRGWDLKSLQAIREAWNSIAILGRRSLCAAATVGAAGCELAPIDFVAFAKACGAEGYRCQRAEEVRPAIEGALNSPNAALVEAVVDANEKPLKPDELKA